MAVQTCATKGITGTKKTKTKATPSTIPKTIYLRLMPQRVAPLGLKFYA